MNYVSNKHFKLLLPPYKNLAPNSQDQRNPLATGTGTELFIHTLLSYHMKCILLRLTHRHTTKHDNISNSSITDAKMSAHLPEQSLLNFTNNVLGTLGDKRHRSGPAVRPTVCLPATTTQRQHHSVLIFWL